LTDASPNSPAATVALSSSTAETSAVFTAASAKPRAERSCWFPHAEPSQVKSVMVGVPLPPKS
jgi:hypothetical protein